MTLLPLDYVDDKDGVLDWSITLGFETHIRYNHFPPAEWLGLAKKCLPLPEERPSKQSTKFTALGPHVQLLRLVYPGSNNRFLSDPLQQHFLEFP